MLQPPLQRSTAWMLSPYSYQILVSPEQLIPIRRMRGSLSTRGLGDILHDLMASSFGRNHDVIMLLGMKLIVI